jgi:hypothetical protein
MPPYFPALGGQARAGGKARLETAETSLAKIEDEAANMHDTLLQRNSAK